MVSLITDSLPPSEYRIGSNPQRKERLYVLYLETECRRRLGVLRRFTEYAVDMTAVNKEVTNSEVTDEKEIYVGYGADSEETE